MKYYYLIKGRCFESSVEIPKYPGGLNESLEYVKWKSIAKFIDMKESDLEDLTKDLWLKKSISQKKETIDITDYILQNNTKK